MRNSKLIEALIDAPAGSNVKVVAYLAPEDLINLGELTDDGLYRLELNIDDVNNECSCAEEDVTLYL